MTRSLWRPDIADVEFLVGCLGGEVLVEKVRCDGLVVLAVVVFLNFCFRFGDNPFPRISRATLWRHLDPIGKLVMDPLCTVAAPART